MTAHLDDDTRGFWTLIVYIVAGWILIGSLLTLLVFSIE